MVEHEKIKNKSSSKENFVVTYMHMVESYLGSILNILSGICQEIGTFPVSCKFSIVTIKIYSVIEWTRFQWNSFWERPRWKSRRREQQYHILRTWDSICQLSIDPPTKIFLLQKMIKDNRSCEIESKNLGQT